MIDKIKNRMKKVKIIFSGWINAPNGAARFVLGLKKCANDFAEQGVRLSIFTLDDVYGEVRKFSDYEKIKKRASLKDRLMRYAKYSHLMTYIMIYFSGLANSKRILKAFEESKGSEQPDIFHFQDLFTCYYYLNHRRDKNILVYLTLHSNGSLWSMHEEYYPLFRSWIFGFMKRRIEDVVLNRVDKVNFVADFPRRNFCHLYPNISSQKTSFVYNGIPDIEGGSKCISSTNQTRLVCVGTLCNRKNQIGILHALSKLTSEQQKYFSVTFVGDGPSRNALEKVAATLSADMYFAGNSNQVNDYLTNSDAFILFSKDEGLPISIIEAMRCGLPIISTRIAGIPEMIVEGISGYLVDADERQLSELFEKILIDRPDFVKMGEKSRIIYEDKFSQKAMILSYAKLWQKG